MQVHTDIVYPDIRVGFRSGSQIGIWKPGVQHKTYQEISQLLVRKEIREMHPNTNQSPESKRIYRELGRGV